jgi:hypothetical protein
LNFFGIGLGSISTLWLSASEKELFGYRAQHIHKVYERGAFTHRLLSYELLMQVNIVISHLRKTERRLVHPTSLQGNMHKDTQSAQPVASGWLSYCNLVRDLQLDVKLEPKRDDDSVEVLTEGRRLADRG